MDELAEVLAAEDGELSDLRYYERLALAVATCLATTTSAMAVDAILLAPTEFSRSKGKPQIQADSFLARNGFARLLLTNGNSDGTMAVRSATIRVNGVEVPLPNNLDPGARDEPSNADDIELHTAPGFSTSTQVNFSTSGFAAGYVFFSTPALILASP